MHECTKSSPLVYLSFSPLFPRFAFFFVSNSLSFPPHLANILLFQQSQQPLSRYLSSIGELIFLDQGKGKEELVIIDPQWFCSSVMGRLFEPDSWVEDHLHIDEDGSVLLAKLKYKLELSDSNCDFAISTLEHLLLIARIKGRPYHVLVPSLIRSDPAKGFGKWRSQSTATYQWVGGRMFLCTYNCRLSAGMFPKLQALLHRPLLVDGKECEVNVKGLWPGTAIVEVRDVEALIRASPDQQGELRGSRRERKKNEEKEKEREEKEEEDEG